MLKHFRIINRPVQEIHDKDLRTRYMPGPGEGDVLPYDH